MIPSPESSYAIRAVADEALTCKESRQPKCILFLLDGNSNLDLATFKDFVVGAVGDETFPDEDVRVALERVPQVKTE